MLVYYSTDGTTWTQKESIALLEIKMVDGILYGRTGKKLYSYATKDAEKKEFSVLSTGFCKGNSHYLNTATHIIDMRTGLIVVESSTCEAVSDEPPMSKVWALKKSGIWRDQDGAIIPVPSGKMEITYLCITKNVMICDNSFLYVNGEYICVLPETTSLWRVIGS